MKNYVSDGDALSLPAPYAVASGAGALIGSIFGVAQAAYASGATGQFQLEGVFDLPKPGTQAWTVGAIIYWDDTAKNCTTVVSTNKKIGAAVLAVGAGAGETTGRVYLPGALAQV